MVGVFTHQALGCLQDASKADDCVERCPQLMRHIGKEVGLGGGGRFGAFTCFDELGLHSFARLYVSRQRQQTGCRVWVWRGDRSETRLHPDFRAILAEHSILERSLALAG